jgi:hypothetical protein
VTGKPVAVGFGISSPDQAAQVAMWGADGVIAEYLGRHVRLNLTQPCLESGILDAKLVEACSAFFRAAHELMELVKLFSPA